MKQNAKGQYILTSTVAQGLFTPDGYTRYTDQTANSNFVGSTNLDGSLNVTILANESTWTGLYAKNGSLNVVVGAGNGVYSSCGAYNVQLV